MLPGGRYEVRCYPAWDNYPTDDVAADTRRMNAFIEERVLEMPRAIPVEPQARSKPVHKAKIVGTEALTPKRCYQDLS